MGVQDNGSPKKSVDLWSSGQAARVENSQRELVFREFMEALVRVGIMKFNHEPKASTRVRLLLENNVLVHAMHRKTDYFRRIMITPAMRKIEEQSKDLVSRVYNSHATEMEKGRKRMTLRDFMRWASSSMKDIRCKTVMEAYLRLHDDDGSFSFNNFNAPKLELELLPDEFWEGIAWLVHSHQERANTPAMEERIDSEKESKVGQDLAEKIEAVLKQQECLTTKK